MFLKRLFASPQNLFAASDAQRDAAIEEEERLMIDEDGNAAINLDCPEVEQDFLQHVAQLKEI